MYFKTLDKEQNAERYTEISDYHLKWLAKIYNTCNAQIVLSSTWRELDDPTNDECMAMWKYLVDSLAKYGMSIYGKTPYIDVNRPKEILAWLEARSDKDSINYVILDDDFQPEQYAAYGLEKHLVKTEFWSDSVDTGGLQAKHVKKAIQILSGTQGTL